MSDFNKIIKLIQRKAVYDNLVQHLRKFTPSDVQQKADLEIQASYGDVTVKVDPATIEEVASELQKSLNATIKSLEELTDGTR